MKDRRIPLGLLLAVVFCAGWLGMACESIEGFFVPVDTGNDGKDPDPDPLLALIGKSSFYDLVTISRPLAASQDFSPLRAALWSKLQTRVFSDTARLSEHQGRALAFGDKIMRFSLDKIGAKLGSGYPVYIALHGGGGTTAAVNDSQWAHMKIYYKSSVAQGLYVAPRGVTNTWNLHFVEESYPLYDRLIENLVAFENADPDRIYLLGFSAGGDGVYQITPRMADRFAAANMSAGHHNWIGFDNLHNTPFLIQVGERDSAYNRNRVGAENTLTLDQLEAAEGGYVHEGYLHAGGSHNSWRDNQPDGAPQKILADPEKWLYDGDQTTTAVDTNAVHWLDRHARNPYPEKIVWDPRTLAVRDKAVSASYLAAEARGRVLLGRPQDLFYWLDIGPSPRLGRGGQTVVANLVKGENRIEIPQAAGLRRLRVLLRPELLDLSKPIQIAVEGAELGAVQVSADLAVMTRTLLERGDPRYLFDAEIDLVRSADTPWKIQAPSR